MFILIDVQPMFVDWIEESELPAIQKLKDYVVLSRIYNLPILSTLEEPTAKKGDLIDELKELCGPDLVTLAKNSFNLASDPEILAYLKSTGRDQVVISGCETDVCVMQSCLGLLKNGMEVFLSIDGIFSSTEFVQPAIDRMVNAGAQPLVYKSFYYELLESVERSDLPKAVRLGLDIAEKNGHKLDPDDDQEETIT
jgi:nicotinamidase-related amidase